jgi:hypothetical protein
MPRTGLVPFRTPSPLGSCLLRNAPSTPRFHTPDWGRASSRRTVAAAPMPALQPPDWRLLSTAPPPSGRSHPKEGSLPPSRQVALPLGDSLCGLFRALARTASAVHCATRSLIRSSARLRNSRARSQPSRSSTPRRFRLDASVHADWLLFHAAPDRDCSPSFLALPIRSFRPLPGVHSSLQSDFATIPGRSVALPVRPPQHCYCLGLPAEADMCSVRSEELPLPRCTLTVTVAPGARLRPRYSQF